VIKAEDVLDYTKKQDFSERFAKRFGAAMAGALGKVLAQAPFSTFAEDARRRPVWLLASSRNTVGRPLSAGFLCAMPHGSRFHRFRFHGQDPQPTHTSVAGRERAASSPGCGR